MARGHIVVIKYIFYVAMVFTAGFVIERLTGIKHSWVSHIVSNNDGQHTVIIVAACIYASLLSCSIMEINSYSILRCLFCYVYSYNIFKKIIIYWFYIPMVHLNFNMNLK